MFPKKIEEFKSQQRQKKERTNYNSYWNDFLGLSNKLWPTNTFYDKQIEIINSVRDNYETVVVAGNMLGKDYVAGFIALSFFLTRMPCRVVTTSADHPQLEAVLWGEIRRFIQNSAIPLSHTEGGPLVVNHLHLRKIDPHTGKICPFSYMIGRVSAKGEGLLGHHVADTGDGIPRTLFLADEASGVDNESWEKPDTWAKKKLAIGNPFPCINFFREAVREGDIEIPKGPSPKGRKSKVA
jgi:hypothetical protein